VRVTHAIKRARAETKSVTRADAVELEKAEFEPGPVWRSLAFSQEHLKAFRSCNQWEEEEELKRAAQEPATSVSPAVAPLVQSALSSPGRPLDRETRAFFERGFGRDLGHVQIHTGAAADASAAALHARAYTLRDHVVFRSGHYSPDTHGGRRLIAHELAHVVQGEDPSIAGDAPVAGAPGTSGIDHVQRNGEEDESPAVTVLPPDQIEQLRQHAIQLSENDQNHIANHFPNGFHLGGEMVDILSIGGDRANGYRLRGIRVSPPAPLLPAVETYIFNVGKARSILVTSTTAGGPSVALDLGGAGTNGPARLVQAMERMVGGGLAQAPQRVILSHTDTDHFNACRQFLASATFANTAVQIATEQLRSAVGQRDWTRMGITLSPSQQLIELQVTATAASGSPVHINRQLFGGFMLTEFRSVAAHQALMDPARRSFDKNATSPVTIMVDTVTGERTLFTADGTGRLFNEVVNAVGEAGFLRLLGGSGGMLRTVEYPHHGGRVAGAPDVSGVLRVLRLSFEASDGRVNFITQTSAQFSGAPGASIRFLDLAGVPVERVLEGTGGPGVSEARRIRGTTSQRVEFDMTGLRNVLTVAQTHETQIQQAYQRLHDLRTLNEQARIMQEAMEMAGAPASLRQSIGQVRTDTTNSSTSLRDAANRVWVEMETTANASGGLRASANMTAVNTQVTNLAAETARVNTTTLRNDLAAHEANLNAFSQVFVTLLRMYSALQGERYEELNQLQGRYRALLGEVIVMVGPREVSAHVRSAWAATRADWTPQRLQQAAENLGSMAAAQRNMTSEYRIQLLESLTRQAQLNQLAERAAAGGGRQVYRADGTIVTPMSTRIGAGILAGIEILRIALELGVQIQEANRNTEAQMTRDRVEGVATVLWWAEQGVTPTLALVRRHWFTGRRRVVSGSMSQADILAVARGRPPANTPDHEMVVVTDVPDRDLLFMIATLNMHVFTLEDWHRVNGRNPSGETFRKFDQDWGVRLWSEEDGHYVWKIKPVLRDPLEALHRNLEAGQRESMSRTERESQAGASTIRDTAYIFGQDRRGWVYDRRGSPEELDFDNVQPRLVRYGTTVEHGQDMVIMQAVDLPTYNRLSQYYWKDITGTWIGASGGGYTYNIYRNRRGFILVRPDDVMPVTR
jgi:Domain of unknown function (DUF4157)